MTPARWQYAVVALALAGLLPARPAAAQFTGPPVTPRPLNEHFAPTIGHAISTVDNFAGIVAVVVVQGTGKDDKGNTIEFECDIRAMQGVFLARDGTRQRGTLSFT
jgi:hypothetical protein